MTKAVGIAGSPRRNGNSTSLLKAVLRGAEGEGAETAVIHLDDLVFRGCRGCETCAPHGECVVRDALTPVLETLRLADIWVLASPIYFDSVSGQMKTFFDRCLWLAMNAGERQARLTGTRGAAVIVTYEAQPSDGYRREAEKLAGYLGWMGDFGDVRIMSEGRLGPAGAAEGRPELLAGAEALGRELVQDQAARSELAAKGRGRK